MPDLPQTPEGVALMLWAILAITTPPQEDIPRAAWLLDLYADCLRAVQGLREKVDGGAH